MGKEMNFEKMKRIVGSFSPPSKTLHFLPNTRLLGYGWEWAVYSVGPDPLKVVKVPRGIFPEINSSEYLDLNRNNYTLCERYLSGFVAESEFGRKRINGEVLNVIYQQKCKTVIDEVNISRLSDDQREQFIELASRVLIFLKKEKWLPDFDLKQKSNGIWRIRNLMYDDKRQIKLVDFTAYYDVFKLNFLRRLLEIYLKQKDWKKFSKELRN